MWTASRRIWPALETPPPIDDAGNVGDRFTEHLADILYDSEGHLVTSLRVVKDILGCERIK